MGRNLPEDHRGFKSVEELAAAPLGSIARPRNKSAQDEQKKPAGIPF
jgi:hypothetical protein